MRPSDVALVYGGAFLAAILAGLPAAADDRGALGCGNVLAIPRSHLLIGWKLRASDEQVVLDGSRVCRSDGLLGCDWEYRFEDVGILRPEPGTVLRVVSTFRSHLTGSGAWSSLDILECQERKLTEVFSSGEMLYGGSFSATSPTTFLLTQGHWLTHDPMCCPSHEKVRQYSWDRDTHSFVMRQETYYKRDTAGRRLRVPRPVDGDGRSR